MPRKAQAPGGAGSSVRPRRSRSVTPKNKSAPAGRSSSLVPPLKETKASRVSTARSPHGDLVRHAIALNESSIDPDVIRVVQKLVHSGHEAYLVGGCVRDLLLGRSPKDFDVATSARPDDVRALFRNSRVIGRRFRLVHVIFAERKVIEVATFRRSPQPLMAMVDEPQKKARVAHDSDLLIRNDNVFGTIEEDALRRDFSINALFYDLETRQILDFCSGIPDIERRAVRTIGDPVVRFREDPIRILRAIKFAGKLDLGIDPDVIDAMLATRDSLALAARPRLFEEILRLMRGGAARRSLFLAWEMGLLHVILPELGTMLDDIDGEDGPSTRAFRLFAELDRRTEKRGEPFDDIVLWTLLLLEPLLEVCEGVSDRMIAVHEFCEPIMERLTVHRRIADAMRRILAVLPRLYAGKLGKLVRTDLFEQAVAVAEIVLAAQGQTDALARLQNTVAEAHGRRDKLQQRQLSAPRLQRLNQ